MQATSPARARSGSKLSPAVVRVPRHAEILDGPASPWGPGRVGSEVRGRSGAPRGSRLAAAGVAERLGPWPQVLQLLKQRGVPCPPREGETADAHENRIATALMALYRDTQRADSFEALYAFTRVPVLQWIRGLLHRGLSHLDPSELLQDTFVNVYRYPAGFRDEHVGSFRVWVRTIAGNIVRRSTGSRWRDSHQELPEGPLEPADRRGNPAELAQVEEQEGRLRIAWMMLLLHYRRAWEGLSPRDRRTLHLVEVEGLTYAEAGEVLGVGRSNMKMIVFRARKRVARRMRQAMNACLFQPLDTGEMRAG